MGQITELAKRIYDNAKAKGFHEYKPRFGVGGVEVRHLLSWMALINTEVAEASEEIRLGTDKDGLGDELADVIIRTLDSAYALGIDIEQSILTKVAKNELRPPMHGNKLC